MNTTPSSTLHFTSTTASDRPRSDQDQPQVDATKRVRAAGERALVLGGAGSVASDHMERTSAVIGAAEDAADMRRRMGAAALETDAASHSSVQTQWRGRRRRAAA
jgi:NTE family protein